MKVLIAGAGIGGLTAAICCAHRGMEVVLLERATELGEVGAGIQIPPNATKVFTALGIGSRIARDAVRPTAIRTRMGLSGRTIFDVPLASEEGGRWGADYFHIHRADYISALCDSLPGSVDLHLGREVSQISQDTKSVTVDLADGECIEGDVLIGADGIHSVVRAQLFGADTPSFTGNVAWRATVPIDRLGIHAPAPVACAWMGPGRHGVTYRLRGGTLANFVGVVEHDAPIAEGWKERGEAADALRDFAGWHPTITSILEAVEDASLYRWALYDRPPLAQWSVGRATLLGDAAHPMLPFLAQGAAMAVEDAWVLAEELSKVDPIAALNAYENRRIERTARVQAASRANMKTFHKRTLPDQLLTYGPMWLAGKVAPWIIRKRLDWLYGHDVTR